MTSDAVAAPAVRRAGPDDAVLLAALGESTFRAAFAAANDPADLEAYLASAFRPERIVAELADPAVTHLVAETAVGLVGYATLRAGAPDPVVTGPDPVELERIYAAVPGQGVGLLLLRAALDEAARAGHRTLWLGVWDENPRAVAFYEREGFALVGTHPFVLGSVTQTDLVMARPV